MRTTLITGGAGFVGSALTNTLLSRGRKVVVVDNLFTGKREFLQDSPLLSFEKVDIRDHGVLERVFEKYAPTEVYHLAAIHYIPYCNEHPGETYDVNVWGTKVLIEVMKKYPPEKFFFMSTAAIYDAASSAQHELLPNRPDDVYGKSKTIGEDIVRMYATRSRVPTVIGRLFNVYGPNETNPHLIPVILEQLAKGARSVRLGNVHTKRDYIFVTDVVEAVLALMSATSKRSAAIANIGTGHTYTAEEVVRELERILGENIQIEMDEALKRASDRPVLLADVGRTESIAGWRARVSLAEGLGMLAKKDKA